MGESYLETLREEIKVQCRLALIALEDLKTAIEDFKRTGETKYIYPIWYSIHAFLVTTANISKLFWPPRPLNGKESNELLKLLKEEGLN